MRPKPRGLRLLLVGAPQPARVRPGARRPVRALPLRRDPLVTKRREPDMVLLRTSDVGPSFAGFTGEAVESLV